MTNRIFTYKNPEEISKSLDTGVILEHLSVSDLPKGIDGTHVALPAATMVFDLADSSMSIRENGALEFINRYQNMFKNLTDIIYRKSGIIEKFPGDGITMHFVQKNESEDEAYLCRVNAIETAVEIIRYMFNKENVSSRFRLSLTYGCDTIATKIGSDHHEEWISIGHAVNVAHKLEKEIKDKACIWGMDSVCYSTFNQLHPKTQLSSFNMPDNLTRIKGVAECWYGSR